MANDDGDAVTADSPGEATMFNHNLYIYSTNSIFRRNIISRPSSIGLTFSIPGYLSGTVEGETVVDDNLFLDCETF